MQNLNKLVKDCGVELYDTEIASENGRAIYRIYITKTGGVNLDDCEKVSRLLSPIFDVEPPINGDYTLEVSSPGLERKLEKLSHFASSVGELIKFTAELNGENKKMQGEILSVANDEIEIKVASEAIKFNFTDIKKAKTYIEW